jgi:hypothetical protein
MNLDELRGLLRRVEQQQLEVGDWSALESVVWGFIEEVGAGDRSPAEGAVASDDGDAGVARREPN